MLVDCSRWSGVCGLCVHGNSTGGCGIAGVVARRRDVGGHHLHALVLPGSVGLCRIEDRALSACWLDAVHHLSAGWVIGICKALCLSCILRVVCRLLRVGHCSVTCRIGAFWCLLVVSAIARSTATATQHTAPGRHSLTIAARRSGLVVLPLLRAILGLLLVSWIRWWTHWILILLPPAVDVVHSPSNRGLIATVDDETLDQKSKVTACAIK